MANLFRSIKKVPVLLALVLIALIVPVVFFLDYSIVKKNAGTPAQVITVVITATPTIVPTATPSGTLKTLVKPTVKAVASPTATLKTIVTPRVSPTVVR
jgi:hypothetical protein